MKLKLSTTSAALALGSIIKNAGADSKAVLADKIAASYEKQFDVHDGDHPKRAIQHARELHARLRKNVAHSGGGVSATNIISGVAGASKRPDVGILGARGLRPDNSNLRTQKRATGSLIANVIKKSTSPDIGILGRSKARRHRSSIIASKLRLPQKQSVKESPVEGDQYHAGYFSPFLCSMEQTVNNASGTFLDEVGIPTCECKDEQLSTCGPDLCKCLNNSQGDITSCMDEVTILCEGNDAPNSTNPFEPTLTMDQCSGGALSSVSYCTAIPCALGGGSYEQCTCDTFDHICNISSDPNTCAISTCCQEQTDDAGRLSCLNYSFSGSNANETLTSYFTDDFYTSYGSNVSLVTDTDDVFSGIVTDYYECTASSPTNSAAAECLLCTLATNYCELYSELCDLQTCCQSQTDAAAKVDCFTSTLYETCINNGYSKYYCLCQKSSVACGLAEDPKQCEVHECCYSSMGVYDDGDEQMKACLENQPSPAVTVAPTNTVSITNPIHTNNPNNNADAVGVHAKASKAGAKASKAKAGKSKGSKANLNWNSPAVTASPTKPASLVNPIHTNNPKKPTGTGFHNKAKASKAAGITSKAGKSKSSKKANLNWESPAVTATATATAAPFHPASVVNPIHAKYPVAVAKSSKTETKASKSKSSKV